MKLNTKPVIILAGGFGTRLKEILKGQPKPLADINGDPFIKYILDKLIQQGFNNFIFSLHYESQKVIDYINSLMFCMLKGALVEYIIEPKPLGTGGAISYVLSKKKIDGSFLVINADTWLENGYAEIGDLNENTLAVVPACDTNRYGIVEFDSNFFVNQFKEKNQKENGGYINAGLYNLNSNIFEFKPKTKHFSLELDLFPTLVNQRELKVKILNSKFIDIGVPDDYYNFCNWNK